MDFDNIIIAPCNATPVACAENQYRNADDECVDCPTIQVSLTATDLVGGVAEVPLGSPVELQYNSSVPDIDSSVVTLEYNGVVQTLTRNLNGVFLLTPEFSMTVTIRAVTECGTVTAELDVTPVSVPPCVCPDGLPDCLELDTADPSEIFLNCFTLWDAGGDTLWNGQLPRISDCRWGYEFPNDLYIVANGPTNAALSVIVELIECDPFLWRLTFTKLLDEEPVVAWQGECVGLPYGPFILTHINGCDDEQLPEFSMVNCVDCTKPVIRFDPPSGSVVNFPTLVFLHASISGSAIYYGIDEDPIHLYSGPISLSAGQVLKARAIGPASVFCAGDEFTAIYTSDAGLDFDFICDGPIDKAGIFDEFEPNGVVNDYHWRIKVTRGVAWTLRDAKIYETDAQGVWVTGQAWATLNPIYPIELDPAPFSVYPMVFFDTVPTQLNTAYVDPVDNFLAGLTTLHAYGQPAVPLTGYFRLEFTLEEEGGDPFTIYKLIPHFCDECPSAPLVTASADCEGDIDLSATLVVGFKYRFYRAALAPCGSGVHQIVQDFIATSTVWTLSDEGTNGCLYSYFFSVFCAPLEEWIDGAPKVVEVPAPCDLPESFCNTIPIIIPAFESANPYPSLITVVNRPTPVVRALVQIFGYRHQFPDDVEILLVGPDGTAVLLMNDCGGPGANQIQAPGVNILFSDAAAAYLPDVAKITAGTYKPTAYGAGYLGGFGGDGTFFLSPAPAPAPVFSVLLSSFIGKPCNGVWKLFVNDDHGLDAGAIQGGWCLYLPLA